jgi:hypothetical protein
MVAAILNDLWLGTDGKIVYEELTCKTAQLGDEEHSFIELTSLINIRWCTGKWFSAIAAKNQIKATKYHLRISR